MPVQVQGAVDFDAESCCSCHIRQQGKGCTSVVAIIERSVKAAFAHIGGGAAIFNLRRSRNIDLYRTLGPGHVAILNKSRGEGNSRTWASCRSQHIGGADGQ